MQESKENWNQRYIIFGSLASQLADDVYSARHDGNIIVKSFQRMVLVRNIAMFRKAGIGGKEDEIFRALASIIGEVAAIIVTYNFFFKLGVSR